MALSLRFGFLSIDSVTVHVSEVYSNTVLMYVVYRLPLAKIFVTIIRHTLDMFQVNLHCGVPWLQRIVSSNQRSVTISSVSSQSFVLATSLSSSSIGLVGPHRGGSKNF
jgi:hypothetical protein